jgi:hypothetical protein
VPICFLWEGDVNMFNIKIDTDGFSRDIERAIEEENAKIIRSEKDRISIAVSTVVCPVHRETPTFDGNEISACCDESLQLARKAADL